MDKQINLTLSTDETNLVLEALGNLPFIRVYETINKIQEQAAPQLNLDQRPSSNGNGKVAPSEELELVNNG